MLVSSPKIEVKIILISVKTMRVNKKKRENGEEGWCKNVNMDLMMSVEFYKVENKTKIFL